MRAAVIGGGPRGLSAVERLLATAAETGRAVEITVFEPFALGSGRVWRRDQSHCFLMNTPSHFPTVMPSAETLEHARALGGAPARPVIEPMTFDSFRQIAAADPESLSAWVTLSEPELENLRALTAEDYPRRATCGAYLECVAARLAAAVPEGSSLTHSRRMVTGVEREGEGFLLTVDARERLSADAVILAVGHVDAELNPSQSRALEKAGHAYFPPSIPADVDWSQLPAGADVVIRGMGLNFFDVVTELTQGRGGEFAERPDGRLTYVPSGQEPRITALSRRGLPYAAKPDFSPQARRQMPVFASQERLEAMMSEAPVDFTARVRPLLAADAQLAYWQVKAPELRERLQEVARGAAADLEGSLAALWEIVEAQDPADQLDIERAAKILVGREFASADEYAAASLAAIEADADDASHPDASPRQHAVFTLNECRWTLKEFVARGLLTDDSCHRDLRGWFEPLIEGLASGPPSRRIAELAGLIRAGVVSIAGPSPALDYNEGRFRVRSAWVQGQEFTGDYLVEAMMPANSVRFLASPLVRSLFSTGLAEAHRLRVDGADYTGTGFEVTGPERTVVGADGTPTRGLHCLGLQLSSTEWGTAIAAKNGGTWLGGALTIADADAMARSILT